MTATAPKTVEYCNWTFWEVVKRYKKWAIARDCDDTPLVKQPGIGLYAYDDRATLLLNQGDSRNYKAYRASLQPQVCLGYPYPRPGAQCPNCGKEVNGVNPYDDGETWRK